MAFVQTFALFCFLATASFANIIRKDNLDTSHEDKDYWMTLGAENIKETEHILNSINTNVAKNIIVFVGDGMSLTTQTAGRIYQAQYKGRQEGNQVNGEESFLTFERFPHAALSKTYSVDAQTTDSSSTATALFSGVKTNRGTLGFDNSIKLGDAYSEVDANKVETIFTWAQEAGKDTGFVTTTTVTSGTPAALYAHTADRDWECDSMLPLDRPDGVKDIAWQLVNTNPGRNAKVVLGGGRAGWMAKPDNFQPLISNNGEEQHLCWRQDGNDLINLFLAKSTLVPEFKGKAGAFVENKQQMMDLDISQTDYLLGLFSFGDMKYDYERDVSKDPSLAEMTETAIRMLEKNDDGFFLMVENEQIDSAHHNTKATKAMHETMALDLAVQKALELTNPDETLIIVTADHAHTLVMAGYSSRGSDIRGLVDLKDGQDDKPFSILSYANGNGFNTHLSVEDGKVARLDLNTLGDAYKDFEFQQASTVPRRRETHSGSDTGIFALGPFAHMFRSVHEQNYVAHVMAYSACVGPYKSTGDHCQTSSSIVNRSSFVLLISVLLGYLMLNC